MKRILGALLIAATLAGCGGDGGGGGENEGEYAGPSQRVVAREIDEAKFATRTKYKSERYCSARKPNGSCRTYSTRRVANGTETYVTDDKDWILVLEDGTRVDVDEATYNAHPEGSVYP